MRKQILFILSTFALLMYPLRAMSYQCQVSRGSDSIKVLTASREMLSFKVSRGQKWRKREWI